MTPEPGPWPAPLATSPSAAYGTIVNGVILRQKATAMHELSVCRGILDAAHRALEEFPSPPQVVRVVVRIGRLTNVTRDSLEYYFDVLKLGTTFSDAALAIEEVPAGGLCNECGAEFETDDASLICPACGSNSVELNSGRELKMVGIEVVDEPSQ